jgi:hypothetical protein
MLLQEEVIRYLGLLLDLRITYYKRTHKRPISEPHDTTKQQQEFQSHLPNDLLTRFLV